MPFVPDTFSPPADASQAISQCRAGSIVLVTVDVEPPKGMCDTTEIREHYEAEFGDALPRGLKPAAFTAKNLSRLSARILARAVDRGLEGFVNKRFEPLFNFVYEDGHKMLTVGGMITDEGETRRLLLSSSLMNAPYIRRSLLGPHYRINVPVLTRRERLLLDAAMPIRDHWKPREFEISRRDVADYRKIYRFAPVYAELIL